MHGSERGAPPRQQGQGGRIMTSQEVLVPMINIEPLMATSGESYTDEDRAATGSALLKACETHGLFFLTGHGISASSRRRAFDNARHFFSLPESTKREIPAKKGGFTRGYVGFGGESGSHLLECKEAFSYGFPWPKAQPPGNPLQGPNIWPENRKTGAIWQADMTTLFRNMVAVNEAVARGISSVADVGLPDLPDLCRGGETISLMRVFHYLPYSNDDDCGSGSSGDRGRGSGGQGDAAGSVVEGVDETNRKQGAAGKIGSSPHTDWGLSTSIMQDGAGGLQFLEKETQRWIDVPCAQEDALVFNCGDYLSLLSNGRLKSPVHQVVTTGVERTSFVFFYYPNFNAKLPAAPAASHVSSLPGGSGAAAGGETAAAGAAGVGTTADGASSEGGTCTVEVVRGRGGGGEGGGAIGEGCPPVGVGGAAESTKVGGTAAAAAAAENEAQASIGSYNTLLDLKRGDVGDGKGGGGGAIAGGDADESFGQYLLRKWGAVFRE